MFFGDALTTQVRFGDVPVSAMYFGDVLAWTAELRGDLRIGIIHLIPRTAEFGLQAPSLDGTGQIELQRKDAEFQQIAEFETSQIQLLRYDAGFNPSGAVLETGDIQLLRENTVFQLQGILASGNIELNRSDATFSLIAAADRQFGVRGAAINHDNSRDFFVRRASITRE